MSESSIEYADPLTAPFWAAAAERRLIIQRCQSCGSHQFYPRPFCLTCQSDDLVWADAAGLGEIYALTTVRMNVLPELQPPYQVAIVQLDEGPRFLGGIVGDDGVIGGRVEVRWREREDLPPLPVFAMIEGRNGE